MRAWYDVAGFDRRAAQDERGIRESAEAIGALVERERERGIAASRILIAGFSQGGAMALFTALRWPERLGAIVALSTYLPLGDTLREELHPANAGLPVFMAHGQFDPILPQALGEASRDTLTVARLSGRVAQLPDAPQRVPGGGRRPAALPAFGALRPAPAVEWGRARRAPDAGRRRLSTRLAGTRGERRALPPDLADHLGLHLLHAHQPRRHALPPLGGRRLRAHHRLRLRGVHGARRLAGGAAPRRPRAGRARHGGAAGEPPGRDRGAHLHEERRDALGARLGPPGLGPGQEPAGGNLRRRPGHHRAQEGRGGARGADPRARGQERRARALRLHRVARPQEPADHDPRLPLVRGAGRRGRKPGAGARRSRPHPRRRRQDAAAAERAPGAVAHRPRRESAADDRLRHARPGRAGARGGPPAPARSRRRGRGGPADGVGRPGAPRRGDAEPGRQRRQVHGRPEAPARRDRHARAGRREGVLRPGQRDRHRSALSRPRLRAVREARPRQRGQRRRARAHQAHRGPAPRARVGRIGGQGEGDDGLLHAPGRGGERARRARRRPSPARPSPSAGRAGARRAAAPAPRARSRRRRP